MTTCIVLQQYTNKWCFAQQNVSAGCTQLPSKHKHLRRHDKLHKRLRRHDYANWSNSRVAWQPETTSNAKLGNAEHIFGDNDEAILGHIAKYTSHNALRESAPPTLADRLQSAQQGYGHYTFTINPIVLHTGHILSLLLVAAMVFTLRQVQKICCSFTI